MHFAETSAAESLQDPCSPGAVDHTVYGTILVSPTYTDTGPPFVPAHVVEFLQKLSWNPNQLVLVEIFVF